MKMTLRQCVVLVCDVMFCIFLFGSYMQSEPAPTIWAILSFSAFLVIALIGLYFFVNFLLDVICDW